MLSNKWKTIIILFFTFALLLNLQPILTIADDEFREHKYKSEHADNEYEHDEDEDKDFEDEDDYYDEYENENKNEDYNNKDQFFSSDKNQNTIELSSIDINAFTWNRYQLPKILTYNTFYQQSYTLLNSDKKSIQVKVLINDGIVYIPLKKTAQFFKAEILWHPKYEVIEVKTADKQLLLKINSAVSYENGKKLPMPGKTYLLNDTVYIPAGVLIDGLGYTAEWEKSNQNRLIIERR